MPWTNKDHKTFQCSWKSPSTSPLSTTLPSPLAGQRLRQPTLKLEQPRVTGLLPGAISWTVPHRPRLRTSLPRTRTHPPIFFHHAATAQYPSILTSIYHPWPDRTSATMWFRPTPPLTPNRNDMPRIKTRRDELKARCTTPRERYQNQAPSRIPLLGG